MGRSIADRRLPASAIPRRWTGKGETFAVAARAAWTLPAAGEHAGQPEGAQRHLACQGLAKQRCPSRLNTLDNSEHPLPSSRYVRRDRDVASQRVLVVGNRRPI